MDAAIRLASSCKGSVARADFIRAREQGGCSSPAHGDCDVARDRAPGLRGAKEPATQCIKETGLEVLHDVLRHVVQRKPGYPFTERRGDHNGGVGVHPASYCTTSFNSVCASSAC